MRRLLILLFFLILPLPAAGQPTTEETLYQDARKAYYEIQGSAEKRRYRHNWIKAIDKYVAVHKRYPGGKRGGESLYMAAKLYEELNPYTKSDDDLRLANDQLESLLKAYPESPLADDAAYMLGKNYTVLKEREKAREAYTLILERYKDGDRVDDAREALQPLGGKPEPPAAPPAASPPAAEVVKAAAGSGEPRKGGRLAHVTDVRHWSNPSYTRIVIDLDGRVKYDARLLRPDPEIRKPPRLYIDIHGARKEGLLKEEFPIDDGLLKRARAAQHDGETVRVVLDIESIKEYNVFPMLDPFRIVIDVRGEEVIKPPSIEVLLPGEGKAAAGLKESVEAEAELPADKPVYAVRKIVLDPGHGGRDPGAIGRGGTREKDVTLKIAKLLKVKLEKEYGYQVILTRDNDRYLRLEERTAIANMESADLFISIHANANRNRKAFGMETYIMNARASDRYVSEVAARENAVTSNSEGEYGTELEGILGDMFKTVKVNDSNRLATLIQESMNDHLSKRYNRIRNLGVKKGPFYVLIGANMPSILVEAGYISNKMEEKRLTDGRYVDHLSKSIAIGVNSYSEVIKTAARL